MAAAAAVAVVVLVEEEEEEVGKRIQEEGVADKGIVGEEAGRGGAAEGNVVSNSDSFEVVGPIEDCNFEYTDLVFAVVVAVVVAVAVVR